MGEIIKLTVVLTVVSVTAALAIAFTNSKTRDRIIEQNQLAEYSALRQIMPAESDIIEKKTSCSGCPSRYWISGSGGKTVYAFKISNRGYGGTIQYLVGITDDGKVAGVTILEQSETPGLGSRLTESISRKYIWSGLFAKKEEGLHWFTKQFEGIDINKSIAINRTSGEWHKLDDKKRSELLGKKRDHRYYRIDISTRAITDGLENSPRLSESFKES